MAGESIAGTKQYVGKAGRAILAQTICSVVSYSVRTLVLAKPGATPKKI